MNKFMVRELVKIVFSSDGETNSKLSDGRTIQKFIGDYEHNIVVFPRRMMWEKGRVYFLFSINGELAEYSLKRIDDE